MWTCFTDLCRLCGLGALTYTDLWGVGVLTYGDSWGLGVLNYADLVF